MLYVDHNATVREIFSQVEGVSQHGLDELFDEDVKAGRRSFAEAVIGEGIATKENVLELVGEFLGYEMQVGAVEEIEAEVILSLIHI